MKAFSIHRVRVVRQVIAMMYERLCSSLVRRLRGAIVKTSLLNRGGISSVGRALDYTLFNSFKNLFYKNIEAEICGSFKINLRAERLKKTQLNLYLKSDSVNKYSTYSLCL